MEYDDAQSEGKRRTAIHTGQASQRILCEDHDVIGAAAEIQFGREFGLQRIEVHGYGGDPGYDFLVGGLKLDTKATWKKLNLLVPADKPVRADLFILGLYVRECPVEWVGWATRKDLKRNEPRAFGHGFKSYHVFHTALRPMDQLRQVIEAVR